jgi:hypothetical protein
MITGASVRTSPLGIAYSLWEGAKGVYLPTHPRESALCRSVLERFIDTNVIRRQTACLLSGEQNGLHSLYVHRHCRWWTSNTEDVL